MQTTQRMAPVGLQFCLLSVCLMGLAALCGLQAQVTTTTIRGTIADSSGAVVPNAHITVTNLETGVTRSTDTNAAGEYLIEFLPVGNYRVDVEAEGFKKFERTGIVLDVNQIARVDAVLDLGAASETVSVTGDAPMVNTENASIGRTVDNNEIIGLPIVNRNVYTLLTLTPGVESAQNSIVLGYPEQRTLIHGGADGGSGSVAYYLDGGNNMTGLRNTGNITPNPDAIVTAARRAGMPADVVTEVERVTAGSFA